MDGRHFVGSVPGKEGWPNKEAAEAVHREGHGLMADEIVEVKEGS